MGFLNFSSFAVLFLLLPIASHAAPVTMECDVKGSDRGWISDKTFFEIDDQKQTARVMDDIVMHFEGAPKSVKVSENSDKKLVLTWRVDTRVGNQTAKMNYRLALFKAKKTVSVQAHPHGYANNLTSRGKCKAVNGRIPTS